MTWRIFPSPRGPGRHPGAGGHRGRRPDPGRSAGLERRAARAGASGRVRAGAPRVLLGGLRGVDGTVTTQQADGQADAEGRSGVEHVDEPARYAELPQCRGGEISVKRAVAAFRTQVPAFDMSQMLPLTVRIGSASTPLATPISQCFDVGVDVPARRIEVRHPKRRTDRSAALRIHPDAPHIEETRRGRATGSIAFGRLGTSVGLSGHV